MNNKRHKCYCTNIHHLPITENNDNNIKNKITTSLITCKIVNKYDSRNNISNTWNEMDHHNIIIIYASNKTQAIMICSFGHFNMFKGVYLTVLDKGQRSEVILTHKTLSCFHKVQFNHYIYSSKASDFCSFVSHNGSRRQTWPKKRTNKWQKEGNI